MVSRRGLSAPSVKAWSRVHTWSSLICTGFLLLLCVTGLPLIFHDEIDALLGDVAVPAAAPADAPRAPLDRIVAAARAARPAEAVRFATPDDDAPVWTIVMGPSVESNKVSSVISVDARTAEVLRASANFGGAATKFIEELHAKLLSGQTGSFILCAVGVAFLISIVSGVVLYGPFMRRIEFGTVRRRARRTAWLDLHNLFGIATTLWLVVVGATGIINTLSQQIAQRWQATELAEMIAPWKGQPAPPNVVSPQAAMEEALRRSPGMRVSTVAFPGTAFAGGHHYDVFLKGDEAVTGRIIKPVLIDAATGAFADTRELPLYAQALFMAQPLHFGDYGGIVFKFVWAAFDAITIFVLLSGVYLYFGRSSGSRFKAPREQASAS